MYENHLTKLLELTKKLLIEAEAVDPNMENNEGDRLEKLQELFEERQETIGHLSRFTEKESFHWTVSDRDKILELKKLEEKLQPLINGLHKAFGEQLNRINQTKQMSKKYIGAYQNMGAGGAFIDQRK